MPLPSCFVILPCRTHVYRTFSYLLASRLRTAMMQVSKDTPDELAAPTIEAARARCKACAEEAAKGDSECSEDASNVHSKIWSLH